MKFQYINHTVLLDGRWPDDQHHDTLKLIKTKHSAPLHAHEPYIGMLITIVLALGIRRVHSHTKVAPLCAVYVTLTTCCIEQPAARFRLALLQWQVDIARLERGRRALRHVAECFACGVQFDQGTSKVRQRFFKYMHMHMPGVLI